MKPTTGGIDDAHGRQIVAPPVPMKQLEAEEAVLLEDNSLALPREHIQEYEQRLNRISELSEKIMNLAQKYEEMTGKVQEATADHNRLIEANAALEREIKNRVSQKDELIAQKEQLEKEIAARKAAHQEHHQKLMKELERAHQLVDKLLAKR